jgi:hypothetical protein
MTGKEGPVAIFVKDPGAMIDYAVAWTAGYLSGEQITESVWAVAPEMADGLAVVAGRIDAGKTVVTLSGGRLGQVYRVSNRIRLSDGRSDERTLVIRVEER